MRGFFYMLTFISALSFLSCGPYEGPLLNPKVLKRLSACPKPATEASADRSFNAMLSVLGKNGWTVRSLVIEKKVINARKCKSSRRYKDVDQLQRAQADCLDIHAEVGPTGAVGYTNPGPRRFHWKIQPKVKEWIADLERDYEAVRCYNTHELQVWRASH